MINLRLSTIILLVFTTVAGSHAASQYHIISLGTFGGTQSFATAVNERGHVTGIYNTSNGLRRSFFWTNGVGTDLGTLSGYEQTEAYDLNNSDMIVGRCIHADNSYQGFIWSNGVMTGIGTMGGTNSMANGLSENGALAGISKSTMPPFFQPFFWTNGTFVNLTSYNANNSQSWHTGNAQDVNEAHFVVGQMFIWTPFAGYRPFIWKDFNGNSVKEKSEVTILGTLGGQNGIAADINDWGLIVGHSERSNGTSSAFLVTPEDRSWKTTEDDLSKINYYMQDLGRFAGGDYGEPLHINNSGVIVGSSRVNTNGTFTGVSGTQAAGQRHAFIIEPGETLTDINTLTPTNSGWIITEAREVNESGLIAGYGVTNGRTEAVLLVPLDADVEFTYMGARDWLATNMMHVAWRARGSNLTYTLYKTEDTDSTNWSVVLPTSQWPRIYNFWNGPDESNDWRATKFRVEATANPLH